MIQLLAQVTSTVWKVEKHAGDTVREGEILMILESMKMEMPVESPRDGIITEINVVEGQAVEEGTVLAVLQVS